MPFTGRREQLDLLLSAAADPAVPAVLIVGGQGVGKSRLAAEAAQTAQTGQPAQATTTPNAWSVERAAATSAAAGVPLAALATLLPQTGERDPLALIRATVESLAARAAAKPLLLVVDDVHVLDDASLTLLTLLTATPGVFQLLTVRGDEPAARRTALTALWKDHGALRLELGPLDRTDTDRLVEAVLGERVPATTRARLWETSLGNPLFLHELLIAEGSQARPAGGLADLVHARLDTLSEEERQVLEILATVGPVSLDLMLAVTGEPPLEAATEYGLIAFTGSGQSTIVHLAHPVYGTVIGDHLSELRKRVIRRLLAGAASAYGAERPADAVRLALYRLDAGERVAAPELLAASRYAESIFSTALAGSLSNPHDNAHPASGFSFAPEEIPAAERLARAAWQADRSLDTGLRLSAVLLASGKVAEAENLLDRLGADPRVQVARAALLFWAYDRAAEAMALLDQVGSEAAEAITASAARLLQAGILLNIGQVPEAARLAAAVMDQAADDLVGRAKAAATLAAALALTGRPGEAIELADAWLGTALELAERVPEAVGQLMLARVYAARVTGALAEAETLARLAHRAGAEHGSQDAAAVFLGALGQLDMDRGLLASAARRLREAAAYLRERDLFGYLPYVLASLTTCMAQQGIAEDVPEEDEVEAGARYFDAEIQVAEGWRLAASGWPEAGIEVMTAAAEAARAAGLLGYEVNALHEAVRLGAPARVVARLAELADQLQDVRTAAYAAHAEALAATDGDRLDHAAAAFEQFGACLLAAEAAAEAASAHALVGNVRSALISAHNARTLAARCEGAATPALRPDPAVPALTQREREIAELAAAGLPNRAIAARLVVSVRTVENHLYRLYNKLRVADRHELAQLLQVMDLSSPTQ